MLLLICNNQLLEWKDRKITRYQSPRRLRAKYTPRTNLRFVLRVFRPCGEPVSQLVGIHRRYGTEKIAVQFSLAAPPSNAVGTAAAGKSVAKEVGILPNRNGDDL